MFRVGPGRRGCVRKLIVRNAMVTEVITIAPSASIQDAVNLLLEHRISGLPVVDDDGALVGMIDERDIIVAFDLVSPELRIETIMQPCFRSASPEMPLVEVHELFRSLGLRRLAVCDKDNHLIGIVGRRDLLRLHMQSCLEQNEFQRKTMRRPSSCFELGPLAAQLEQLAALSS